MKSVITGPLFALLLLALGACATPMERVVLLPSEDGRPAAVEVASTRGPTVVIATPYTEARVARRGEVTQGTVSASEVEQQFAAALGTRPPSPRRYTLYFVQGSDELRRDSEPAVAQALRDIAAWPAPEVTIVGHTDTRGEGAYNDTLSQRRAERIAGLLAERFQASGVPSGKVSVAGRGEREPAVPTADEVDEPRNRRVVIEVR